MPISQTDQLFSLVKSLTKSEKRNFRLYVNRMADSNSASYIQLFDLLDKQKSLDEEEVFRKIIGLDKSKFSNLKRHLYTQVMTSLEQVHTPKRVDLQIRELLNFAHILYGKGLYLQALKILQKAKVKAERSHYDLHYLSILEFEKKIESRHITRSGADYSLELVKGSKVKNKQIINALELSNLRLLMHNTYIKYGHVKNEKQADKVTRIFTDNIPYYANEEDLGIKERAYLYQSFVWYYFILLDFHNCYIYAEKWVKLFKESPYMAARDPDLLMRGYYYLLLSANNNGDFKNYKHYLDEVEKFRKDNYKKFNNNSQIMSFLYVHNGRLNHYFMEGKFDEGLKAIPQTLRRINRYGKKIDPHRIMILYYKIAWMNLGARKPDVCVDYLQKIINLDTQNLRTDIQIFTRLMFLMAHYDLENEDIMEYLVKNTEVFFKQKKGMDKLPILCLDFFRKIVKTAPLDRREVFIVFEKELMRLRSNKYEKRAFFYLDIPAWIRSKIKRVSLSEAVK
ncbi:MAG: hypothetical protein ACI85O_002574 [Saprospiraceae bacterium]|jgi:hypothetical protein